MEPLIHRVDQHTADGMECLLAAAALAVSSATSAASSGQMQICVRVSLCCNVSLCSFDATLCCFDWCLGVETAIQSDRSAKRPDGHWLCMLCPATIRSHQSNRPYQAGRAHNYISPLPNEIEFELFHLSIFHQSILSSPLKSYSLIPMQQRQLHLPRELISLILFDL
jgi:hypothetical protein